MICLRLKEKDQAVVKRNHEMSTTIFQLSQNPLVPLSHEDLLLVS